MVLGVSLGFLVAFYINPKPNLKVGECILDPQEPSSYFKIKENNLDLLKGTLYFKDNVATELVLGQIEVSLSKKIAKNYKTITCP